MKTWIALAFGVIAFLVIVFYGEAAEAAPQCNDRTTVLELLEEKYSEVPVAYGVANNGGMVEVLSTGDGETWSIIITSPKGMSCLVAAGEGWRMFLGKNLNKDPEA